MLTSEGPFDVAGADLSFLSCSPHEVESLFPPLTYLKVPSRELQTVITESGVKLDVLDVEPLQLT